MPFRQNGLLRHLSYSGLAERRWNAKQVLEKIRTNGVEDSHSEESTIRLTNALIFHYLVSECTDLVIDFLD